MSYDNVPTFLERLASSTLLRATSHLWVREAPDCPSDRAPKSQVGQTKTIDKPGGGTLQVAFLERIESVEGGYFAVPVGDDGGDLANALVYFDREEIKQTRRRQQLRDLRTRIWNSKVTSDPICVGLCICAALMSSEDTVKAHREFVWPEALLDPARPEPVLADVVCVRHLKAIEEIEAKAAEVGAAR